MTKSTTEESKMDIQVHTDHNIEGSSELQAYVTDVISDNFDRYKNAITRVVVHLSDENAGKISDNDKKCLIEARIANHRPVVVSHNANNIHQAIQASCDKLLRSLDTMVGKMTDRSSARDFVTEQDEEDEDFE